MGAIFRASAPAKIILFGEHSVVYGKRCIAASIDLRTDVEVQLDPCPPQVSVEALDERTEGSWQHVSEWSADANTPFKRAVGVVVAMAAVAELHSQSVQVRVSSTIPPGRGLGSSAAFSVALSAAFLAASGGITGKLDEAELSITNAMAFRAEKLLHGNPSGVDNTISCYGGFLSKLGDKIERLKGKELTLLVIDTNVDRQTASLVGGVKYRLQSFPDIMYPLLDVAGQLAEEASSVLRDGKSDMERLSALMEMNQGMLESFGVGHAEVSRVVSICKSHGCRGVKITGAGGGGCLIALLAEECSAQLRESLGENGFSTFEVVTGGTGVTLSSDVLQPERPYQLQQPAAQT
mmetsp:Transcript_11412/g.34910  ORF Transcript_11412/g.34910 Transcript_11412/m.34910 type:complete len:350 (+) Transcript_11412:322-1371(+)